MIGKGFLFKRNDKTKIFSSGPIHIERRIYVKGLCLLNFPVTTQMTKVAEPVSLLQASESTKKKSHVQGEAP